MSDPTGLAADLGELTDAERDLIVEGIATLRQVKRDARQAANEAMPYGARLFSERDFGIPQCTALIEKIMPGWEA